jgi:hypothetical protein
MTFNAPAVFALLPYTDKDSFKDSKGECVAVVSGRLRFLEAVVLAVVVGVGGGGGWFCGRRWWSPSC